MVKAREQVNVEAFLRSKEGKTMLSGHSLRRALPITPQYVNERWASTAIELHETGRSGIARPLGSITLGTNDKETLYVTHYRVNPGQKHGALEQLATALATKFHLKIEHMFRTY